MDDDHIGQLEAVIAPALAEATGLVVMSWTAVVETINGETGEPEVWTITPKSQPIWTTQGMIEFAREVTRGRIEH